MGQRRRFFLRLSSIINKCTSSTGISVLFLLALLGTVVVVVDAQETISPQDFYEQANAGLFKAVVDVRTQAEWDQGHIPNATFVKNLASGGLPTLLEGCEMCRLVIYCQSGNRAGTAIQLLKNNFGFQGELLNGRGVNQWTDAGFSLVSTESTVATCANDDGIMECLEEEEEEGTIINNNNDTIDDESKDTSSGGPTTTRTISNKGALIFWSAIGTWNFFL